ncbi:NADH-quinone oxidoreductase subunit N [Rhodoblastus acidophilus]|uniref:NADH-quinone oxidoreductase subunit NuoN n=1 Tax=Rhodoblastus acidophilus TaxID=1074 RepID=UPI00222403F7|nr:NADH-quinone oxidoreductase subunit NuoN [Rhodoblastus acidophilus]MCW2285712.1 NADH-quinone oxidoreductase subunit N [Rhodoblastus acidophilus]MCW2333084.1 NADH-quinone oxidoreductase subunit N [Rhodoblastus acidophilus]
METLQLALVHALPEVILAIGVIAMVLVGAFRGKPDDGPMSEIAVVLLGAALVAIVLKTPGVSGVVFDNAFVDDRFGDFMKALALIGSIVTLLMAGDFFRGEGINKFEFPILVVLATLGMMMLISANGLIALYLGLELMSLALYVTAALSRDDARASEAGLKYFVLGALSSGMLLYGASLLYGFSGNVSFAGIAAAIGDHPNVGVIFGLVFLFTGLAFKMSVVPFHMWTPDVYEGAPTPVTAFFASAPKMAAVAIATRVIYTAFPGATHQWQQIVIFMSIASMALGAFAAIKQDNIKRLMAYSSIGHMGFALVGLAAGTEEGVKGVLFYMAIYLVMTLGAFAAILSMRVNGKPVEKISDLSGLDNTNRPMALFIALLMVSLSGVPPLAGFFAKWYVFLAAVQANLFTLAVIGVLCSAVAAFYYWRIIKVMYFDDAAPAFDKPSLTLRAVLAVSAVSMLLYWVYPAPLVQAADSAAKSLF